MARSSTRSSSPSPSRRPRPRQLRSGTPEPLTVAGRGNLGRSLARAFRAAGRPTRLVASRAAFEMPRSGIVFLAVPDGAITETAARIARLEPPRPLSFVHLSGALGLDALEPLSDHPTGSFHPLQSFPAPRVPAAFRGITIAVDASTQPLTRRLRSLARSIGARPKHVAAPDRVLYHAAAVYASNFLDVVVNEAVRTLRSIGWTGAEATDALLPLVEGAVANIRKKGSVKALTGPIRRGDADTVRRHLGAVENPDLYRMLASVALEIAAEAGLEPAAVERTRKTLVKRALTRDVAATRRRGRR